MTFAELIAAAERGAASIYHHVLATGEAIVAWESSPLVAPLVAAGVSAANEMLSRAGVSNATRGVIASDVVTALKTIVAADPTVPSSNAIGALTTIAGSVASAIAPGAAPLIGGIEAGVGLIEHLVEAGATITQTSIVTAG